MSEKITFQELVESIAEETDRSKQFTHDFFKDFVDVIHTGLEDDGVVNIAGLGKFKLRRVDEREGYNPQTEEKMTIPAHNKIVFKPYKNLREEVNAPYADLEPELLEEKESATSEEDSDKESSKQEDFLPTSPTTEHKAQKEKETGGSPLEAEDPKPSSSFELEGDAEESDSDIVEFSGPVDKGQPLETEDEEEPFRDTESTEEPLISAEQDSPLEEEPSSPSATDFKEAEGTGKEEVEKAAPPSPNIERNLKSRKKGSSLPFIVVAAGILLLVAVGAWYFSLFPESATTNMTAEQSVTTSREQPVQKENQQQAADVKATAQKGSSPSAQRATQQTAAKQSGEQTGQTANKQVNVGIKEGQTLWSLAEEKYGNPRLWPWIYGTNESLQNPNLIIAGSSLSVPLPSGPQNTLTSSDSVGVSKGYLATYSWYRKNNPSKAKNHLWAAKLFHDNITNIADVQIDKADLAYANKAR